MGRYHDINNSNNNIRWFFLLRKRDLFYGLILIVPCMFLGLLVATRSMPVLSSSSSSPRNLPSSHLLLEEGYLLQHGIMSTTTKWTSAPVVPVRQDNPTIVSSSLSSSSSIPPHYWDLSNPNWPLNPPALLPDCKVVFRQNNNNNNSSSRDDLLLPQRLCHIVPWGANFGDELGPPIVKRILELYFHCSAQDLPTLNLATLPLGNYMNRSSRSRSSTDGDDGAGPCLLSVGSMWRMAQSGDHLWGTGVAFDGTVKHRCVRDKKYLLTNLTIYSSRGPNSVAQIHKYCPFASKSSTTGKTIPSAGDAGFLVPYLFPEYAPRDTNTATTNATTSSRMCIIPHHDERNNPQFRMAEHEHGAIRLTVQQSWETMVKSLLTKCDKVLSSSLHGLILAEALGIASKRLQLTQKPGNFKFDDFYQSYRGSTVQSSDGSDSSSNTAVITMDHLYARNLTAAMNDWLQPLSIQQRDAYARRILETFPIHLFETVQVPTHAIRTRDCFGRYPLHYACDNDDITLDMVTVLVADFPRALTVPDVSGYLPLHYMCRHTEKVGAPPECADVLDYIMTKYPDTLRHASNSGQLALHIAAEEDVAVHVLKNMVRLYPQSVITLVAQKEYTLPIQFAYCCTDDIPEEEWLQEAIPVLTPPSCSPMLFCRNQGCSLPLIKYIQEHLDPDSCTRLHLVINAGVKIGVACSASKPKLDVVKWLVQDNPTAVSFKIQGLFYPFRCFFKSKCPASEISSEALEYIVDQYPAIIKERDNRGMLPIQ